MLHLHTSKPMTESLQKAGCTCSALPEEPKAWHWHVHRFALFRKRCIIAMEEESRYAMLFLGLKKKDLARFDRVFAKRLLLEARWLCALDAKQDQRLTAVIESQVQPVSFSVGMNRSVQSHIRQAIEEAEIHVAYHLEAVPESLDEILGLGLYLNKTIRKRKQDRDYFVPMERWRDALLTRIHPRPPGQVISLADFRARRKDS
jgi:hypothetical protein